MNYLATVFHNLFVELYDKIQKEDFVIDKTGCKIVEILTPVCRYNLSTAITENGYIDYETRKSPRKYCSQENEWYISRELNIKKVNNVTTWTKVCDENDEVNSNYGYLVYSKGNFSQFTHCLNKLKKDQDTRQAIIIYTRPSIQLECNDLGGSDFICTNYQQFFIRNGKLHCITSMRSNDCIFGLFNDQPWFIHVAEDMYNNLKEHYSNLELGDMIFIPNSFHAYEHHFDLVEKIAKET